MFFLFFIFLKSIFRAAELMIDPYVNLALKSNGERLGANKYMDKLLRWELSREPFADNISKDVIVPFDQSEELVFKLPVKEFVCVRKKCFFY